ncbi:MAG: Bug family tripartite tricarboxylate transporter substrate binding protein [Beijerinckiaceae bacterium]
MIFSLRRARSIALAACSLFALSAIGAQAETAQEFFKGKTIKILVPYGAGGGYDIYARMLAPYFGKYLAATVIVQNKVGASGMLGMNQVYTASPDGTELVFYQGTSAAAAQISGDKAVRFDLMKMSHIATVAYSPWVLLVQPKSPVNSIDDLKKFGRPITFGGNGPMSADSTGSRVACMALKLDCKLIVAYKGSREVSLALTRGELDAYYVSDSSAFRYVRSGAAKALAVFGPVKSIFLPEVKTIFELTSLDAEGRWVVEYNNKLEALGRLLSGPPGIPADRLALLQKMAKEVLTDPKFLDAAKEGKREIFYADPQSTIKAIKGALEVSPEQKKTVLKLIQGR